MVRPGGARSPAPPPSPPAPLSLRERGNDGPTGGDRFPHDPDFPQLAIATDPARMLEVFRTHLVPAPGRRVEIEDCVPFRFRCRQSTSRCVLQYTLRLVDRTPGAERRWQQSVTGVVYAREGEAERQWQEGRAAEPDRESTPPRRPAP